MNARGRSWRRFAAATAVVGAVGAVSACGMVIGLDEYERVENAPTAPVERLDLGQFCFFGHECTSGFCADSVCCDSACDAPCMSCKAVSPYTNSDGYCAPIGEGTDPDYECQQQPPSSCGTIGWCNGTGACQLYDSSTLCDVGCIDGLQTTLYCNGSGVCDTSGPTGSACGTCDLDSTDCSTCQECAINGNCSDEVAICANNPDCNALLGCVNDCDAVCANDPDPDTCFDTCINGPGGCAETYQNGINDFNGLVDCVITQECPTLCGG